MRIITYREAIKEALAEEMRRDPDIYLLGEDIGGKFGGTNKVTLGLCEEFGDERIRNTPISESAIIGAALGSALTGMRPVAEIMFIDFIGVCFDQLMNQVAKLCYMTGGQVKIPLVVRTPGGSGRSAAAQHSQSLEAILCHIPGLIVVQPSNGYDAKGLLKTAIRNDNPVIFIEHKLLYNTKCDVPSEEYILPIGRAAVKRQGSDVTIIATGRMVGFALNAAQELVKAGVDAEVLDPVSLVPLDEETLLKSVRKTGRVLVVYEAVERMGIGAEIASIMAEKSFYSLKCPIQRLGAKNTPMPFSPVMEDYVIPDAARIVDRVMTMMRPGNTDQAKEA
jgi:acetoin:2,6-dichlorophenolindophenol oxidoreductase subunit beta